jgi:hypothetical protein
MCIKVNEISIKDQLECSSKRKKHGYNKLNYLAFLKEKEIKEELFKLR